MRRDAGNRNTDREREPDSTVQAANPRETQSCAVGLEAVVESVTDGFLILDRDWRYTYVNGAAAAFLKTPPEQLIGTTIWEAFPRSRYPRFCDQITHAVSEKTAVRFEEYFEPLARWYECRCYPNDAGLTILLTDATEQKQVEEVLLESRQVLEMAIGGSNAGIWRIDLNPNKPGVMPDYVYLSPQLKALIGFAEDEFPNSRAAWQSRIVPEDRIRVEQAARDCGEGRTDLFQVDFRIRHKDESLRWLSRRGRLYRDEYHRPVRWAGIDWDITERKQMEAALRRLNDQLEEEVQAQTEELKNTVDRLEREAARRVQAEGKLRRRSQMLEGFFRHTITPLAFMNWCFDFVRVNDAFAGADSKEPRQFVGANFFSLYPDPELQAVFERVVQTGRPYRAYARLFNFPDAPQRSDTYWNWWLTPLLDEHGKVQYLVLNLEDATERQKAFAELEHRARQLQKLALDLSQAEDRERKRLADILHDDLQQQLAAVKFHLGLLSGRARGDPSHPAIVSRLDRMLKDAIEKSRSLSHDLSPALLYQSDLSETFGWLADQVQTRHGLIVRVIARSPVNLHSDALKAFLYKTGQELLFNVVKHARTDEARIELRRLGRYVGLSVSDGGRGFDPQELRETTGFGLLSIRERVELLGGRMRISSAKGRGCRLRIIIPDGGFVDESIHTEFSNAGRPESMPDENRLRVLLVDDHEIVRQGLASLLSEQRDIEVIGEAANGREAVDLAGRLHPDVIVMDVAMPLMNGDEATRQIKGQLPDMRIVALSMYDEDRMIERMHLAGAEDYVLKTAPSEHLLAAIRGTNSQFADANR